MSNHLDAPMKIVFQVMHAGKPVAEPFDHYPTDDELKTIMFLNHVYEVKVDKLYQSMFASHKIAEAKGEPLYEAGSTEPIAHMFVLPEDAAEYRKRFPMAGEGIDPQMTIMGEIEAKLNTHLALYGRVASVIVLGKFAHDMLRTLPSGRMGGGDVLQYGGIAVLKGDAHIPVYAVYVGG